MADANRATSSGDESTPLLPDDSVLTLSEYLDMQKAIGNETRFRVLDHLVASGPQSASQLRDALALESNTLHYHLDRLLDVGLVENRKRNEPDEAGLRSFYRATSLGEAILEHGVRELMAEEWELLEAYGG